MLLVTGLLPLWNRLRASAVAQSLLAGANATVVGILLAALYQPIWTSAIYAKAVEPGYNGRTGSGRALHGVSRMGEYQLSNYPLSGGVTP